MTRIYPSGHAHVSGTRPSKNRRLHRRVHSCASSIVLKSMCLRFAFRSQIQGQGPPR